MRVQVITNRFAGKTSGEGRVGSEANNEGKEKGLRAKLEANSKRRFVVVLQHVC